MIERYLIVSVYLEEILFFRKCISGKTAFQKVRLKYFWVQHWPSAFTGNI